MENKTIKTTMNKVMITGKLVKNGLEEKPTKNNVEAIMGSLIVRTSDGSEHEISLFTNKYKKDDNGNFTNEESKLYTAYRTIIDEYRGMDELSDGESPMIISITNGEFTDNVFKSKEGKLIESNKIRTTFVTRVDETKLDTTPQTATFHVSGIIKDIKAAMVYGVPTVNKLIYLDMIGYQGTIIPIKLTIVKDMVDAFMSAGFYPMGTAKLNGVIVNTVEEVLEEQAFGEPVKVRKTVKRYEVKGGSPLGTLESIGIGQDIYEAGKSKRRLKLQEIENNNSANQTGFTTDNNINTQTQPSNPFSNPFAQQ